MTGGAVDKLNVLMVDDQPDKLLAYEAILAGLGETLLKAATAREALSILLKQDIAVILMDVNMRPEIAAKVAASAGNFTAAKGADQLMDAKLKAQFAASFPGDALKQVHWYPAVPAGIEEIEGRVLDRVKAAN